MKDEHKRKYVQPSYYVRLSYQWHKLSQGSMSAKDYVTKFDKFLIHCSALSNKCPSPI